MNKSSLDPRPRMPYSGQAPSARRRTIRKVDDIRSFSRNSSFISQTDADVTSEVHLQTSPVIFPVLALQFPLCA